MLRAVLAGDLEALGRPWTFGVRWPITRIE